MKPIQYYLTIIFVFFTNFVFSQDFLNTVCTASAEGKIGDLTVNYTIGEPISDLILEGESFILTSGVNQPLTESLYSTAGFESQISIFPNPTVDFVTVDFYSLEKGTAELILTDIIGTVYLTEIFSTTTDTEKTLALQHLKSGTYLLKVLYKNSEVNQSATFKIFKNN